MNKITINLKYMGMEDLSGGLGGGLGHRHGMPFEDIKKAQEAGISVEAATQVNERRKELEEKAQQLGIRTDLPTYQLEKAVADTIRDNQQVEIMKSSQKGAN